MSKIFKDEKIFNKFKKQFKQIFKDKNFIELTKNHFNKNGSLAAFTLAVLQNRVGEKKISDSARINSDEWIDLFTFLYQDDEIKNAFEKLNLNPLITLENIEKYFSAFENFIHKLLAYIEEQNWDINISKKDFTELLTCAYGYLLYNSIECKLNRSVSTILEDKEYDKKYVIILNNTKLFAKAKSCILKHCELKINDLIVILLGGSNHLALDK